MMKGFTVAAMALVISGCGSHHYTTWKPYTTPHADGTNSAKVNENSRPAAESSALQIARAACSHSKAPLSVLDTTEVTYVGKIAETERDERLTAYDVATAIYAASMEAYKQKVEQYEALYANQPYSTRQAMIKSIRKPTAPPFPPGIGADYQAVIKFRCG